MKLFVSFVWVTFCTLFSIHPAGRMEHCNKLPMGIRKTILIIYKLNFITMSCNHFLKDDLINESLSTVLSSQSFSISQKSNTLKTCW